MGKRTAVERAVFSLTCDLPAGVSVTQMRRYIENALVNYFEDRDPENPTTQKPTFSIGLLERHVKYHR